MLGDYSVFPILLSTDLAASRIFYGDTLGLELLREDEGDRLVFRCGGGTQLVITMSTVGTADPQTQIVWRVPDLKAAPRGPSRPWRPDRGMRGARTGYDGRRCRYGPLMGRVVHRPEPECPGSRPAKGLTRPVLAVGRASRTYPTRRLT